MNCATSLTVTPNGADGESPSNTAGKARDKLS
jgi:hypothetical protein